MVADTIEGKRVCNPEHLFVCSNAQTHLCLSCVYKLAFFSFSSKPSDCKCIFCLFKPVPYESSMFENRILVFNVTSQQKCERIRSMPFSIVKIYFHHRFPLCLPLQSSGLWKEGGQASLLHDFLYGSCFFKVDPEKSKRDLKFLLPWVITRGILRCKGTWRDVSEERRIEPDGTERSYPAWRKAEHAKKELCCVKKNKQG